MGSGLSDSGTVRDHEEDGVYPCEFGGRLILRRSEFGY